MKQLLSAASTIKTSSKTDIGGLSLSQTNTEGNEIMLESTEVPSIDPAIEKRVRRKQDWFLLPMMFGMFLNPKLRWTVVYVICPSRFRTW